MAYRDLGLRGLGGSWCYFPASRSWDDEAKSRDVPNEVHSNFDARSLFSRPAEGHMCLLSKKPGAKQRRS